MNDPAPNLGKARGAAALTQDTRRLHQAILTAFARTGRPPSRRELDQLAATFQVDVAAAAAELAGHDVVTFDNTGEIRAAYPFSPSPTVHRMDLGDGVTVFAMCAIDALGTSAMLGRPVTITSTEPCTGQPITVQVEGTRASWQPATACVATAESDCCGPSADRTCALINFFTGTRAARSWADEHAYLTPVILSQDEAMTCSVAEFGPLLRPAENT